MKTETNLSAIKETTKLLFDTVPIKEEEFGVVVHPFVSFVYSFNPQTGKMIDLRVPEELKSYKQKLFEFLDSGDIYRILAMKNLEALNTVRNMVFNVYNTAPQPTTTKKKLL